MGKKQTLSIMLAILVICAILFGLTFIPHKIVNINPERVSKIQIFNGHTGKQIEITEKAIIHKIIDNLDTVTFKKSKLSIGYMGYSFNTTIYDGKGEVIKNLIINSSELIRFMGFFYNAVDNQINYDFINSLFEQQVK